MVIFMNTPEALAKLIKKVAGKKEQTAFCYEVVRVGMGYIGRYRAGV